MKKIILSALCVNLLFSGSIFAQQGTPNEKKPNFKQNWYAEGALSNQWLWIGNVNKGIAFGGRLSAGSWFNDHSGIRMIVGYGNRKTDYAYCNSYFAVGLDYNLNLLALGKSYAPQNRFSFNFNIGPAYYGLKHYDKLVNRFAINGGFSAGYDCTPHFGVFSEISFNGLKKYTNNDKGISIKSELLLGVRYRFGKHDYTKKATRVDYSSQISTLNDRIQQMNTEINELRKQIEEAKAQKEMENAENHTVMLAPKSEESSIDIYFDKFSTFLSEEQRQKIDMIGEWLAKSTLDINIVAFSDNIEDKEADERLRKGRADAIRELLTNSYGISPDRIKITAAETIGYKNITGCNAKILFVEPQK